MYARYFGFTREPFDLTPDPAFLYMSGQHEEALAHLLYGITERKGFVTIVGEVGTGKTTLIHTLLDRLEDDVSTSFVSPGAVSFEGLLRLIMDDFELPTEGRSHSQLLVDLKTFLIERSKEEGNAVVIVDEAQNLSIRTLENVRLLSNMETATNKLLQIVLVGQPGLDDLLDRPELRQLRQRISLYCHLGALGREDTERYLMHRVAVTGVDADRLFTPGARKEIFRYSEGIPRLINVIADRSLVSAYAEDSRTVTARIVRAAAVELGLKTRSWAKRAISHLGNVRLLFQGAFRRPVRATLCLALVLILGVLLFAPRLDDHQDASHARSEVIQ